METPRIGGAIVAGASTHVSERVLTCRLPRGEVFPSGFLPLPTGNVLRESPVDLYSTAPVFRTLRDTEHERDPVSAVSH